MCRPEKIKRRSDPTTSKADTAIDALTSATKGRLGGHVAEWLADFVKSKRKLEFKQR